MSNPRLDRALVLLKENDPRGIARAISIVENGEDGADQILSSLNQNCIDQALVLGITGNPGAGKSTLTDELIELCRKQGRRVGVIAIDPSSPLTGGAILGDRIRMMRHAVDPDVIMRSMATRGRLGGVCGAAGAAVRIMASSGCSIIIIETVGVGQSEIDIVKLADLTLMVMAPGLGDDIQAMKAGILEVVDLIAVNKADLSGAESVAMDMEVMLRERQVINEQPYKVCLTVASEGKGVKDLLAQIDTFYEVLRKSPRFNEKRLEAHRIEVLDWSMELLKPYLQTRIKNDPATNSDPRLQAKKMLTELLKGTLNY